MDTNITLAQVNNCLFNGNYKLGKLCGGWHSVKALADRNINLPDNLPDNTSAFLYFNGNVVLYLAGGKAYYNTGASGKLTPVQASALSTVQAQLESKQVQVNSVDLGWHGVNRNGTDPQARLANKIQALF